MHTPIGETPPPTTPQGPRATVIDLTHRLRGTTPPPPADTDLLRLATWTQATFQARGLSLADPRTAATHRATLDVVKILLTGAQRLGRIDEETLEFLSDVLADSHQVPDII